MSTHDQWIDDYEQGIKLLSDAVQGMSSSEIQFRSSVGKWNTHEIVCHLVDFEIINAERIGRVIAEDNPPIMNADPEPMARELAYASRSFDQQMALIQNIRGHIVAILRALEPPQWERTGVHSTDGTLTLGQLVRRVTAHIPHHVKFIEEKKTAVRRSVTS